MHFSGSSAFGFARAATLALTFSLPIAVAAAEPSPAPSSSTRPATESLPFIGRVRAVSPFCRAIVDDSAALAENQLADIATTREALRILAYAPLDQNLFTERRAVRALETLAARLTASRQGQAQVHVAGLRAAARGTAEQSPRPDLARFAGALDGAHSESSRVARLISRALAVLEDPGVAIGGVYLPDDRMAGDPRFVPAQAPVPFPVDPELERFPAGARVENGPLHAYARSIALSVSESLALMVDSIDEARRVFPTAFDGCTDVDAVPSPAASAQPPRLR